MKEHTHKFTFGICVGKLVKFSWKWHRLTLKSNPAVYHWLWFNFWFYELLDDNSIEQWKYLALYYEQENEQLREHLKTQRKYYLDRQLS